MDVGRRGAILACVIALLVTSGCATQRQRTVSNAESIRPLSTDALETLFVSASARMVTDSVVWYRLQHHRWPLATDEFVNGVLAEMRDEIAAGTALALPGDGVRHLLLEELPDGNTFVCLPKGETNAIIVWQPVHAKWTVVCDLAYVPATGAAGEVKVSTTIHLVAGGTSVQHSTGTHIVKPSTAASTTR